MRIKSLEKPKKISLVIFILSEFPNKNFQLLCESINNFLFSSFLLIN